MKHSKISPSKAWIWMHCTCFEQKVSQTSAGHAGTELHSLAEKALTENTEPDYRIQGYVEYVKSRRGKITVEAPVELRHVVPLPEYAETVGQGYCDCFVWDGWTLEVIDLKTGRASVEPENNPQLMIYAYCIIKDQCYQPEKVRITIYQNKAKTWETDFATIARFIQNDVRPGALKTLLGVKEECKGDYCIYCNRKERCSVFIPYTSQDNKTPYDLLKLGQDWQSLVEDVKNKFKQGIYNDERVVIERRKSYTWRKDPPTEFTVRTPIKPSAMLYANHPDLIEERIIDHLRIKK